MSDTWELISGYETTDYTDTIVFEVDPDTKKLEKISGQTLVEGEKNSQFIRFLMPRYWDGIDISEKTIRIIFDLNNSTYFGGSEAVGAERTDDKIRFGWVVPAEACAVKGTLLFVIIVQDTGYILKTQITDTPVLKSLNENGDIPEPTRETWYTDFQVRMEQMLNDAENALEKALSMFGAPLIAPTAADMTDPERVYVYVGSETGYTFGNWYVYDGSAWVSGGVYNAVALNIDSALSATSDNPVKNKAIYEEISAIKAVLPIEFKTSNNRIVLPDGISWTNLDSVIFRRYNRILVCGGSITSDGETVKVFTDYTSSFRSLSIGPVYKDVLYVKEDLSYEIEAVVVNSTAPYLVNVTMTSDTQGTCDKTDTDIRNAWSAGKTVRVRIASKGYMLQVVEYSNGSLIAYDFSTKTMVTLSSVAGSSYMIATLTTE